jgi:hypothetical protein
MNAPRCYVVRTLPRVVFKNMCTTGPLHFSLKLRHDMKILLPNFEHSHQIIEEEVGGSCDTHEREVCVHGSSEEM